MKNFLESLLVGSMKDPHKYVRPALQNQWKNILAVWNNETAATFGIERIFRLLLATSAYLFPGIYIRHYFGLRGLLSRKLALEAYVTCKLFFPLVPLYLVRTGPTYSIVVGIVIYFGVETLIYVLSLLFLSDIYKPPISYKRSYLMILMNYVELCLDFAVIYKATGEVSGLGGSLDAIYFSFVTAFTVGYGDIKPSGQIAKIAVILQSLCSLVLVTLVFTRTVSGFDKKESN